MVAAEPLAGNELEQYLDSMPADYASVFTASDIRQHARIVLARRDEPALVELWRTFPDGTSAIIVVSDDRPGFLSFVGAALVANCLDVQEARAYCRRRADGRTEAVDLFWLRRNDSARTSRPLEPVELSQIRRALTDFIIVDAADTAVDAPHPASLPVPAALVRVSFDVRALLRGKVVLIVEAPDVTGLLLSISRTLHGMGILIVGSEIRTDGAIARDRFTLSSHHGVLDPARLGDIVERVTAAIQALGRAQAIGA